MSGLIIVSIRQLIQEILVLQTPPLNDPKTLFSLMISASLLIIGYGVPLFGLAYWLKKKKNVDLAWFGLAVLFGALVIGQQSGLLNVHVTNLLHSLFPNNQFITTWQPSIAPPLVEESLKLLLAMTILYLSGHQDFWQAVLIGGGVGLGFQLSEDYVYILGAMIEKTHRPLEQAILRFETAYAGHWLLTAMFTGACALLLYYHKSDRPKAMPIWLVSPIILHILWNNPLIDNNTPMKIGITILSWALLIHFCLQNHRTTSLPKGKVSPLEEMD
ncbi:TPA: PrsW family intramembrane metalloprotease [Streptococcus equi subsp. zooepidemicus]|nr:PrsW family intramembrane metalloprotease [Streptococcus equi subsp. zooepidemicus]